MKIQRIVYWISTGLFCLWMISNAYAYLFSAEARKLCAHFGFPDYFRVELGIAKFIGVVILLAPIIKGRPKEWAYAGFVITIISGFIAHLSSGDSLRVASSALIALHILLISYYCYQRTQVLGK